MKKLVLIFFLICSAGLYAQSPADSLWNAANTHYAEARYNQALENYLEIEKMELESADLYYNIGNTYFKMLYVAQAILYYERALGLEPNNQDIAYNLQLAREQCIDKIEPVPAFFVVDWVREATQSLSSDTWAWFAIVMLAVSLLLLLVFYFARKSGLRKAAFVLAVIVFVFAGISAAFAWQGKKTATRQDAAIVFAAVSAVKSSPDAQGKDLLVIHEGTKIFVLEKVGDWARIELPDGRQGWVALSEIVFVY